MSNSFDGVSPTTNSEQRDYGKDARVYEYGSACDPNLKPVPVLVHDPALHESGPTRVHPFDISDFLDIEYPCSSPNLLVRSQLYGKLCRPEISTHIMHINVSSGKFHPNL
jgi:hypothetical protein